MKVNVLGMDPSMSNWGYCRAVLDTETLTYTVTDIQTVTTEKTKARKQVKVSSDDLERARTLADALEPACKDVQIVFVEMPHGSQSAPGMKSYAMCMGLMAQVKVPLVQMTEQDLKTRVLGRKSATKREGIDWAAQAHPEASWPTRKDGTVQSNAEHMADACMAIEAGLQDEQFRSALSMLKYMEKMRA